jgi:hypothetical protein
MQTLDNRFDSFMAATLNFPEGFQTDAAASHYSQALQQIRLGIKQGGCGLTSAALIIHAALFQQYARSPVGSITTSTCL